MSNNISDGRKSIYYIGMGLIAIGFILFISTFFTTFNEFNSIGFDEIGNEIEMGNSFVVAPIGMILMIAGTFFMNLGSKGVAGSGLILDPQRAREDLKPYSNAAGGMINDAMENMDIIKNKNTNQQDKKINETIKIRCRACGEINDEDAKFCKSCGDRM